MERASFLVEKSGDRVECLLNPASIVMRRLSGVRHRQSSSGPLTGGSLKDNPLLYTGGGMTEIFLDLLFDTSLAGSTIPTEDVRDLTLPLARLAEGSAAQDRDAQVPLVRFVWGKAWNVLGVVTAIAERLEQFNADGAPQRSWLRMRFLRVADSSSSTAENLIDDLPVSRLPTESDVPVEDLRFYEMTGGGGEGEEGSTTERLDEIAQRLYGNPAWWRRIANFNNVDDPWKIPAGHLLSIPPSSSAGGDE